MKYILGVVFMALVGASVFLFWQNVAWQHFHNDQVTIFNDQIAVLTESREDILVELNKVKEAKKEREEAQFYRGIYVSCVSFVTEMVGVPVQTAILGCGEVTAKFQAEDAFQKVYPGIDVPMPVAPSRPMPQLGS